MLELLLLPLALEAPPFGDAEPLSEGEEWELVEEDGGEERGARKKPSRAEGRARREPSADCCCPAAVPLAPLLGSSSSLLYPCLSRPIPQSYTFHPLCGLVGGYAPAANPPPPSAEYELVTGGQALVKLFCLP